MTLLRVGNYLIVPLAEQDESYYSLSENQREKSRLNIQKNSEKITYTVVAGDSLWKIAKKYNTSINSLSKVESNYSFSVPKNRKKISYYT